MTQEEVRTRIVEIGIVPAIRVSSAEDALFAAQSVCNGGIPIVEVTMTVPGAVEVISHLVRNGLKMIVGAGTVMDAETARRCLDAGAEFLTTTGLDLDIVELAVKTNTVVFPGALTPTEVISAWKAGADFVKVFPSSQMGESYIRALKAPLPEVPLIATGGVNQENAAGFILAGAAALGIGAHLIPPKAIELRQPDWIRELAHRFIRIVQDARSQMETP